MKENAFQALKTKMKNKKGNEINGWLNIYKPAGITSNQALGKIKRILHPKKIGHAGTLDPAAFGILPIALGEATKTIQFMQDRNKTYRFEVTWGQERNTDDIEGEVTQTSSSRPSEKEILNILPKFIGEIEQVPPKFSAIKIDGERAYNLSRAGEEVEIKSRKVQVYELKPLEISQNSAKFEMNCGKGTYVRSIGRDMGRILGCFGYISELERTRVGNFTKESSILLDKLEDIVLSSEPDLYVLPVVTVLDDIPVLALTDSEIKRVRNGQSVILPPDIDGEIILALEGNMPLGILRKKGFELHPSRLFNL